MRRWLTFVLMLVLPLQFAWAAAATYCQHEPAPATAHIGHHTHQHAGDKASPQAADPDGSQASKVGKLAPDNDCGYCHLSFAKPLLPVALQFTSLADFTRELAPGPVFRTRGPDGRDRPNWRIA